MSLTRRLNFYDGFFTYARDWTEEQSYHMARRQHHRRHFHTPGVVSGLEVRPLDETEANYKPFAIRIDPGVALNNEGDDLIVEKALIYDLRDDLPATGSKQVFLYLRAKSELKQRDENDPENYQRWEDGVDIEVADEPKQQHDWLEIARINLMAKIEHLYHDHIDTRHRFEAGSLGVSPRKNLVPPETDRLEYALLQSRTAFLKLQEKFTQLILASDLRHTCVTVELLLKNDSITYGTTLPLIRTLCGLAAQLADEIQEKFPNDCPEDEFREYRKAVENLGIVIDDVESLSKEKQEEFRQVTDAVCEVALRAYNLAGVTVANAGPDQNNVKSRTEMVLDGSLSRAGTGRTISTYHWLSISLNDEEVREPIVDSKVKTPQYKIKDGLPPGKHVVQLVVIDDAGYKSAPDTLTVTVSDVKPIADAGHDQARNQGDDVYLNGSKSIDPDGGRITQYVWEHCDSPTPDRLPTIRTSSPIYNLGGRLATGKHVFELVVIDDENTESEPDAVSITVRPKF